jgi:hypothetical protein
MAENYPRILAQRPGGALLVALDATTGCVYDPAQRVTYPRLPLAALLAQPYWERYHGHGQELRGWTPPPAPPSPTQPTTQPPATPIINMDEDPDNANWLRILAQRRKDKANEDRFPWLNDL